MAEENMKWEDVFTLNKVDIIIDRTNIKEILSDLGNDVDEEGFVTDKSGKRVLSKDGSEIKIAEIGGILSGSKVFIKENVASFAEHLAEKKKRV